MSAVLSEELMNPDNDCITNCLIEEIDTTNEVPANREVRDEIEIR